MTTNWNAAMRGDWGVTAGEQLDVVLVYEDKASAQRGLALYQHLMTELGVGYEFNLNVWKFAVLALARLDEISTEQAAAADLVIVCARDEAAPAERVQSWFQRWLEVKGQSDCDLVVLGGAVHDQPGPAGKDRFFHRLARRGGVTVFSPAVASDSEARTDGQGWFPRQPHAAGANGWFHEDRRNPPRA